MSAGTEPFRNVDGGWTTTMAKGAPRWIAVALLAVACLGSRWGTLSLGPINPDEAQYSAFASYLLHSGQNAFDVPILHVYTHAIFHVLAANFGDYRMFAPRLLVLVCCFATAWLTYRLALRITSWPWALAAALLFVQLSVFSDGLTANREWFCLPFIMASLNLFALSQERVGRNPWGLAWAGALAASTFWFKEQAVLFVLPVAVQLGLLCLRDVDVARSMRSLLWYGAGVAGGIVGPALPLVWYGTIGMQWDWLWRIELNYVAEGYSRTAHRDWIGEFWGPLYLAAPWRRVWAVGVVAAVCIVLRGPRPGRCSQSSHACIRSSVLYCVALSAICGFAAIQIGGRFYLHYYLLPLPQVVLLVVYSCQYFLSSQPSPWRGTLAGIVLIVAAADFLWLPSMHATVSVGPWRHANPWQVLILLLSLCVGVGLHVGRQRAVRILVLSAFAAIMAETSLNFVRAIGFARDVATRSSPQVEFKALAAAIATRAKPADSLFVWGWRPEIYVDARLPAATRFATCIEVVAGQDEKLVLRPRWDPTYMDMLLHDLRSFRPKFIVDATLCSYFGSQYNLPMVPPFADFLREHYSWVDTVEGCDLYALRDVGIQASNPPTEDERQQRRSSSLDWLSKRFPDNRLHFALNRADLLAQAGKFQEARRIYEGLHRLAPLWSLPGSRMAAIDELTSPSSPRGN